MVVAPVVLAPKHALLVGVSCDYARRGGRGEFGVGHVVGSSVEGQRGLREGVQALRRGVGAAQAAKEGMFHGMQVSGSQAEDFAKVPEATKLCLSLFTGNPRTLPHTLPRQEPRCV